MLGVAKEWYISLSVKIVICLFKIKDVKIPYKIDCTSEVLAKCGSRFVSLHIYITVCEDSDIFLI